MILRIFAIYDKALAAYGQLMTYTAKGQATRQFTDEVNRKDSELNKHPEDYALYFLGDYNNETGEVHIAKPTCVAQALDVKE